MTPKKTDPGFHGTATDKADDTETYTVTAKGKGAVSPDQMTDSATAVTQAVQGY